LSGLRRRAAVAQIVYRFHGCGLLCFLCWTFGLLVGYSPSASWRTGRVGSANSGGLSTTARSGATAAPTRDELEAQMAAWLESVESVI